MAKLTRKNLKLFGSTAAVGDIRQFGSLAAAAPLTTTDPETIVALSNYSVGWLGAILGEGAAAIEDRNALDYLASYHLNYIMQTGLPEWNTDTTYYIGSMVNDGAGNILISTADDNLGNATTDATKWKKNVGQVPIGAVIATFPNLTGAYSTAATTAADQSGWVLCAGQTIADASSPMNGQVVPDINSSVFLLGNTVAGSTGGSSTQTLATANIPAHSHTMSHVHQVAASDAGGAGYMYKAADASTTSFSAVNGGNVAFAIPVPSGSNILGAGSLYPLPSTPGLNNTYYSTGVINSPSGSGSSAATGTALGGSASGSSFSILPPYITAVYLMRVK